MEKLAVALQIKALSEREFEGYGSTFGNVDHGGDIVAPGAFRKTLAETRKSGDLIPMLWMHDPTRVAGKWLDIHEDEEGLKVKGVLADTELGRELHTLLKMDAVRGLSIGYEPQVWDYDDDVRILKQLGLRELSIVSRPMNPLAQVEHVKARLSAAGEYVPTKTEFESVLRNAGCSKSVARRLIYKLYGLSDEPGVTPEPSRCNADEEDLKAIRALSESITADYIRRAIAA